MSWLKRMVSKRSKSPTSGQRAAGRALAREEEKLRKVTAETSEIMEAVENLKLLGAQNDFAVKIYRAMGGT